MASMEAVERRRANRKARREAKSSLSERRSARQREVAVRMVRRYFPACRFPSGPPLVALDYRYWQAKRCGWDALASRVRIDSQGYETVPMSETEWSWWKSIHYTQRNEIVEKSRLKRLKLLRRQKRANEYGAN